MTLTLTSEQHEALAHAADGSAVPILDPASNAAYMLVPQEVYRCLIHYDDSEFNVEEAYPAMMEVAAKAGWNDPEMDVYDKLYPREKP
jgi:hypothetical protein